MHKVIATNRDSDASKLVGEFATLEAAEAFRPLLDDVQGFTHLEIWPHNWIHTDMGWTPYAVLELQFIEDEGHRTMKPWIKEMNVDELRKQLNIHVNKLWSAKHKIENLEHEIEELKNQIPTIDRKP